MLRLAGEDDWGLVGQLLYEFNREFDEPCPPAAEIAATIAGLDDAFAVLIGEPAHGIALVRVRKSIWSAGNEAYLAELWVRTDRRGNGDGRALMERAMAEARERGADHMELNTDPPDTVAHALYRSLGFEHTAMYFEREL